MTPNEIDAAMAEARASHRRAVEMNEENLRQARISGGEGRIAACEMEHRNLRALEALL